MSGIEIELTDNTEGDWEVNTEALSWNVTEMVQFVNVSNRERGSLLCQKKREGRYSGVALTEQHSIQPVLERIIGGPCRVIMTNGWKQLNTSFKNNLLEDSKLRDVFAQSITASKNDSEEQRVFRDGLCTADPAKYCRLFSVAVCDEICEKRDNSDFGKNDNVQVATTFMDDEIKKCLYQLRLLPYCQLCVADLHFSPHRSDGC